MMFIHTSLQAQNKRARRLSTTSASGSRRRRTLLVAAGAAVALLAGTANAATNVLELHGNVNLKNYQGFYQKDYPNYTGPAVVYFNEVMLNPGDASPWHWHEGLAYVVIVHGTITADEGCGHTVTYTAGQGFYEHPHEIHRVVNKNSAPVVLYWSTMYPAKANYMMQVKAPTCK